ncbi:MAG TPA: hypothetical protein VNB88_04645 [Gaiellaceae bacterium]|nr:hypothetical protein [Gaiellaceae bacterium]
MRPRMAIVALAAVLAGCGTTGAEQGDVAGSTGNARIDKCVELLLSRSASDVNEQEVRAYARDTYCERFERNGWIYDDGALRIAAQDWLDHGGTEECVTGENGEPAQTVPCDPDGGIIDCALLHLVRRAEVRAYVAELQRDGQVQCDDGTPLAELGVP